MGSISQGSTHKIESMVDFVYARKWNLNLIQLALLNESDCT